MVYDRWPKTVEVIEMMKRTPRASSRKKLKALIPCRSWIYCARLRDEVEKSL